MFTARTTFVAVVVLIGSSFASHQAQASFYGGAAARIQNNSALLNQEFRRHCAHVPQYRQLLANSKYIFLRAQHIRLLAMNGGSTYHMVNDFHILDRSYHNLEQLLLTHGRTAQVHVLMTRIASDINSLRSQLAMMPRHHHRRTAVFYVQPVRTVKQQPARNYGEIRSGWTRTLSNLDGGKSGSSSKRRSLSSR